MATAQVGARRDPLRGVASRRPAYSPSFERALLQHKVEVRHKGKDNLALGAGFAAAAINSPKREPVISKKKEVFGLPHQMQPLPQQAPSTPTRRGRLGQVGKLAHTRTHARTRTHLPTRPPC